MQLDNFSSRETALLTRALAFVRPGEMDPALADAVLSCGQDPALLLDQFGLDAARLAQPLPQGRGAFEGGPEAADVDDVDPDPDDHAAPRPLTRR